MVGTIQGLENQSLLQRLNSFRFLRFKKKSATKPRKSAKYINFYITKSNNDKIKRRSHGTLSIYYIKYLRIDKDKV